MFSEIHVVVRGRVQRVGYRDFIDGYAKEHALSGWVKNCDDGTVEMVLQGTPDELKDCIEAINRGPLFAKVETAVIDWRTPAKQCDTFSVISS